MREGNVIPVFYSCDDNFVNYMIVSIHSVIENASEKENYRIHILNTNICDKKKSIIMDMKRDNIEICFEDVTEYLASIRDRLPIRDYYSNTTYFRMFIAQMFPQYDKAVYIDSDTVVLSDIAQLYNHDLGDKYLGVTHDRVVAQIDDYAKYVEQVLGVSRDEYFNAGLLVMNCKQFRDNNVLEQFMELLYSYNFVVAQDQDYLNLLCQGKVLWMEPEWNIGVFGDIPCKEEDIKIIHYIMFAKPWHYEDCQYKKYFWDYAKDTPVYEQLQKELEDYTDEQKEQDSKAGDMLLQIAMEEIARHDNYLKLKNSGRLKSHERLVILSKIAELERTGRFDVDVENDPPTRELMPNEIDYLRKKLSSKIKAKLTYAIGMRLVKKLIKDKQLIIKEIKGIENFSNLNTGAIITCNHFNPFDSFATQMAYVASGHKKRKLYRVINERNYTSFTGLYGMIMRNCNTFPLSSNLQTMKKFIKSMDTVLQQGHFMLIYPEQSMWWNYRKPKPLKKGAYTFAVKNNVPVLPCFITMQDSDIIGNDGFYIQEYTIHVGEPIYPDPTRNRTENVEYMRSLNFETWKQIYEETYHKKLTYGDTDGVKNQ